MKFFHLFLVSVVLGRQLALRPTKIQEQSGNSQPAHDALSLHNYSQPAHNAPAEHVTENDQEVPDMKRSVGHQSKNGDSNKVPDMEDEVKDEPDSDQLSMFK